MAQAMGDFHLRSVIDRVADGTLIGRLEQSIVSDGIEWKRADFCSKVQVDIANVG